MRKRIKEWESDGKKRKQRKMWKKGREVKEKSKEKVNDKKREGKKGKEVRKIWHKMIYMK